MSRKLAWLLATALLGACSTAEPRQERTTGGLAPYLVTEKVELSIANLQGLVSWHRDLVVICPYAERGGDRQSCSVGSVDAHGRVVTTGIQGARSARRVQQGILVQRPSFDLVLIASDGSEKPIAQQAWMPGVAAEANRLAYVHRPASGSRIVFHHLGTNETRVVTTDPTAYAPHVIPGTDDVLFASNRTGVASYFVASTDGEERQLTNVGMRGIQKGFVPVALEQLVWLPQTQTAVFTAHYATDKIWKLDVASGEAKVLGPGVFPNIEAGGTVLALDRAAPHLERAPRLARYLGGPR